MLDINVDIERVNDTATKIINNVSEYERLINNFFKRINEMPNTGEWTGNNAEEYSRIVLLDKNDYINFGQGIKDIAKEMTVFANNTQELVQKNERDLEESKY